MLTLRVSDPDPIVLGLGEEQEAVLTAEPAVYVSIADYYEGPYTVTPGTEAVTLETDGFTMSDDVTVQAVPVGSEGVPVATKGAVSNHQIAVTPSVTNTAGLIEGGTRTGASVTVSASELVSGTKNISANGSGIDVVNFEAVNVAVPPPALQNKSETYTPTETDFAETLTADAGFYGIGEVEITVSAIPSNYVGSAIPRRSSSNLTASGAIVTAPAGYYSTSASKSVASGTAGTPTASKVIVPEDVAAVITPSVTNSTGYITGGTKTGSNVVVTARELVSGNTLTCDSSGDWDVAEIETFTVPSGSIIQGYINGDFDDENNTRVWYPRFDFEAYGLFSGFDSFSNMGYYLAVPANTTVTPTESAQTVGGNGYMMEGAVTVLAIPSNYVGSGITRRSSSDLTAIGATVTAPEGYYSAGASKTVASGTEGTPTATKGAVLNHAVSVTPSVTNSAGYIGGGTHTGTAVLVTAAELVSGSDTITTNGTHDVTNLAEVVVNVSGGGSSKNAQTIQSTTRTTSTSYTKLCGDLTVSKTGTYDVYWTSFRSSTSGTWGTQLYIGSTAYGTVQSTFSNHCQIVHLSNVSLTANQKISVYGRSRGSNYYAYVGQLSIIEA